VPVGAGGGGDAAAGGASDAASEAGGDSGADAADATNAADASDGAAGGGFIGLDDGCGGQLFCQCPNGAAAANDACNNGGVCAPADCQATNQPPGPSGASFTFPAVVIKKSVDSTAAAAICGAQRMLTLPASMDELSWEVTVGANYTSVGTPVCRTTDRNDMRISVKLNDCGNINRFEFSKSNRETTDYCVWCDPAQQLNVCTQSWAHQQTEETINGSAMVGVEFKRAPSDFIRAALGPVAAVGIVNRVLGIISSPLDAVAEVKLNKSFGGFVRTIKLNDLKGGAADCPPTGQNCNTYRLQVGPQVGLGAKLKIMIPPRNGWFIGRFLRFGVDLDLSGSVGGIVQFRTQSGDCGAEDCLGLGIQLVGTAKIGLGAKAFLWEGGVQWQFQCRGSVVDSTCLPPAPRRENEPWRCRWSQTNEFSGL
jgi:hypothetical protein